MSNVIPNVDEETERRRAAGRARQRAFRERSPEQVKATKAKSYAKNRERILADGRARREAGDLSWRASHLKRTYGITLEEYDVLLARQNGVCAGCGTATPEEQRSKVLHVDHDHATGEVRGLLCGRCNRALGMVKDDVNVLMSLATYLLQTQDVLSEMQEEMR